MTADATKTRGSKTGELTVRLSSQSMFLTDVLPIEVRDERHQLVHTARSGETVALREGLYSVTAVLESGVRETKHARVTPDSSQKVVFDSGGSVRGIDEPVVGFRRDLGSGGTREFEIVETGVSVVRRSRGLQAKPLDDRTLVTFKAPGDLPAWVVVEEGELRAWVALPVGDGELANRVAVLEALGPPRRRRVGVALAPDRRVARALQQMMESGKIGPGLDLARAATDLLASKYQDPIGAAYGALLLHRFGALGDRASWLENLARDFAWLPDGRILLAAIWSRSESPAVRKRGLAMLLDATARPPTVFAEAFSLGLSLLRRWPDEAGQRDRAERLAKLSRLIAHFDFSATFSTARCSSSDDPFDWGGE